VAADSDVFPTPPFPVKNRKCVASAKSPGSDTVFA
jgi:hypothetical protein